MSKREPLVFGDPNATMTVGVFVRWLEEVMIPHMEKEEERAALMTEVWLTLTGNGNPKDGMSYQHKEMWEITQRLSHFFSTGKLLWAMILSLLVAVAAAASLAKSFGVL